MRIWFALLLLAAAVALQAVPTAAEGPRDDLSGPEGQARLLEGKLTGYGKNFVEVNGEKVRLCKDATILDSEENPITVSGLCATESVQVTLEGSCAAKVRVLILRR